jgi:hypothetical protein
VLLLILKKLSMTETSLPGSCPSDIFFARSEVPLLERDSDHENIIQQEDEDGGEIVMNSELFQAWKMSRGRHDGSGQWK